MDRKTYMRDVYSKYWITAREKRYGVSRYDELVCNYIHENLPKNQRILEAAIGTGIPFSDSPCSVLLRRNGSKKRNTTTKRIITIIYTSGNIQPVPQK